MRTIPARELSDVSRGADPSPAGFALPAIGGVYRAPDGPVMRSIELMRNRDSTLAPVRSMERRPALLAIAVLTSEILVVATLLGLVFGTSWDAWSSTERHRWIWRGAGASVAAGITAGVVAELRLRRSKKVRAIRPFLPRRRGDGARFERAQRRERSAETTEGGGVLRRVAGSEAQVRLDSPATAGVLDVYARVEQPGGALAGLAWLTLRCGSGGAGDCAVRALDLPGTSALGVAHVAPAPEGAGTPVWRFWPLDPEVAALAGPLPPEEGSLGSEGASP